MAKKKVPMDNVWVVVTNENKWVDLAKRDLDKEGYKIRGFEVLPSEENIMIIAQRPTQGV